MPRLAVIGAGIAGLSCATALAQAGLAARVFDKSRGPSGRMSTRRGEDWQCDHGAQYFTARHPEFRAEVDRWLQAGVAALWEPDLQVIGGDPERVPDASLARFVGLPRMTAPAHFLAGSLRVTAETKIVELKRGSDGWLLRSAEHGWLDHPFDAVLLAIPAPQAVTLLQKPSPELSALAAGATMRGCWALMLRYAAEGGMRLDAPAAGLPRKASRAGLAFDAAFVNEGPLRWIARNDSKPGRPGPETWLLHASAEWSEAHLEDSPDSIAAELLQAFRRLGGATPQAWNAHRWLYADSAPALESGCVWSAGERLGLCGDWLNGGKVEGAWRSGQLLAGQVLPTLQDLN